MMENKLTQELLNKAGNWIRKKLFRKGLPVIIVENNELIELDKKGNKKIIKKLK